MFTEEEVLLVVWGIAPAKAVGSDSMSALFYQKFWHIMGKDVCDFCIGVLSDGVSPAEVNDTNIVLILQAT